MAKNGGGLINKLYFGKEKSDDYARSTLPSNRWELFFDIFKCRFGKLIIINLLMIIFFLPLIAILVIHTVTISGFGSLCPYSQPFGTGFMAAPSYVGHAESIITNVNVSVLTFLPLAAIIASVGLSGGLYVIRNMIWTEGIFVANDFWRGIKQNFLNTAFITVLYSVIFSTSVIAFSFINHTLVIGYDKEWLLIVAKVIIIIVLIFTSIMALHMLTMSCNYQLKLKHLFKNSFLFTIGLAIQNALFIALAALPFLFLLLGNFFVMLGTLILILFGFSYALLVWSNYCQWGYDEFINSKAGNKRKRGIYEKVNEKDPESVKKYKEQLRLMAQSSLGSKPIKPITDDELKIEELPQAFNRGDLAKLRDSKQAIIDDHEKYVLEHMGDEEFKNNEIYVEAEKEMKATQKEIERVRRELEKRNKKRR